MDASQRFNYIRLPKNSQVDKLEINVRRCGACVEEGR